jgi:tRNA-2-methylthio-N6-dimethylallyladenosine synthase
MRFHLITYGCQMNTADSEEMAQPLKERGFMATNDPALADVILMNTCTVRDQAEHRADSNIGRLRQWKDANPNRILIIAGCAASRWGDSIQKKYPFIDAVSPATKIEEFPDLIAKILKERWEWGSETKDSFQQFVGAELSSARQGGTSIPSDRNPMTGRPEGGPYKSSSPSPHPPVAPSDDLFGNARTAYITIMRGCNYSCSYCIVPQVRGREKYRPMDEILAEVRAKVAQGLVEVMLLGQTVNSYYWRGSEEARKQGSGPTHTSSPPRPLAPSLVLTFADLLRAVDAIPGVEVIRFMSPHPKHMKDDLIRAMAETKTARHIHLPLQSGSTRMLERMKRLYSREDYLTIVQKLRQAMPGLLITTDLIAGFPGETEDDFSQSLSLMELVRFDSLFAFKYSPRPGTPSADWPDDVSNDEKESRHQRILDLNQRIVNEKRLARSA